MIPACREFGIGLVPYSPPSDRILAGGILGAKNGCRADMAAKTEALKDKLDPYFKLCHSLGEAPADVAVAWVLHNPVVAAPIIGLRTMEQLTGCLRAVEIYLSEETLAKLDEIWPGPGEAPEAWAW
jgi:aryl-alcohol dehydrogenase-like predicted oxidoreductase